MSMLNTLRRRFSQIVDGQGKHIDAEILETVVVLNAAGFQTVQSCGGHPTGKRGLIMPWVDITSASNDLFEQDKQLGEQVMAAYEASEPYWREYAAHRLQVQREIRKAQGRVCRNLLHHLDQFYAERAARADVRLVIQVGAYLRLLSQGAICFLEDEPSIQQRKLQEYRDEMSAFTEFLKSLVEAE